MYSIGNEIPETGRPYGALLGRKLADTVRSLDPSRPVTNAVNSLLAVADEVVASDSKGINTMMQELGDEMLEAAASDPMTRRTEESHAVVDVAGMNYSHSRYAMDGKLFPHRMIVGTEATIPNLADIWSLVETHDYVLGDFSWTAWDYLGEVGLGRVRYGDEGEDQGLQGSSPWLAAAVGDFDIIGQRRPISHYREIVYGLSQGPVIAVQRPDEAGRTPDVGMWMFGDQVASWGWFGHEGRTMQVEVFAAGDEVELRLDDRSLGRAKLGETHRYRTTFEVPFHPGSLEAIAFRGGKEIGRQRLVSPERTLKLDVAADRETIEAGTHDLCFVTIRLTDDAGVPRIDADRTASVEVSGPGRLQGLGSGRARNEERFIGPSHRTHDGCLLAVIRPTGAGTVTVTVAAEGVETAAVEIIVV